jgi:hypothetical protein
MYRTFAPIFTGAKVQTDSHSLAESSLQLGDFCPTFCTFYSSVWKSTKAESYPRRCGEGGKFELGLAVGSLLHHLSVVESA